MDNAGTVAFAKATVAEVRQAIQSRAHSLREEAEKVRREADAMERVEKLVAAYRARDPATRPTVS